MTGTSAATKLHRTAFRTSRLLDFCSRKELIAQTGHQPDDWPLVVLKELIDNALDAGLEAGEERLHSSRLPKPGDGESEMRVEPCVIVGNL